MRIRSWRSWAGTSQAILKAAVSFVGRLMYSKRRFEEPYGFAVTGVRALAKYNPRFDPRNDLGPGDDLFEPVIFSAQYDAEHWSLTERVR